MPANLPPTYHEAEDRYRSASTVEEKLAALEEMLRIMPKHKGTDKLQADLKSRIAKLKRQPKKKGAKRGASHMIPKEGAGQIVLLGPPNTGKSALVARMTRARPEVADTASDLGDLPAWAVLVVGLAFVIINPAVEEALYRGVLYRALESETGSIRLTITAQAIAFGATGAPWFLGHDTLWQLGVPGVSARAFPGDGFPGSSLAVADDGTVWVASGEGLRSFDGEAWTERWTGANLDHIDIAPDGTVVAFGRGRDRGADGYPVVTLHPVGTAVVDTVDLLPEGKVPTDIIAAAWIGVTAMYPWPMAIEIVSPGYHGSR